MHMYMYVLSTIIHGKIRQLLEDIFVCVIMNNIMMIISFIKK